MKVRRPAVGTLALALAAVAHAGGILATPAIYGSYAQTRGDCFLMNIGAKAVTVQVGIFDESGNALTLASDSCSGGPVAPGGYCAVSVDGIGNGVAFACSATVVSGNPKFLRGTFQLTDSFYGPLRRAALR